MMGRLFLAWFLAGVLHHACSHARTYDPLYRLTNEVISGTAPVGSLGYAYDRVGNRTNRTSTLGGITNQTFAYTANDWLVGDVYDANGNTRTNGANVFFYDVENRLTNATVGGTNITIVYDGDGNRVRKIVGTTTNTYLVDTRNLSGYAQVVEERVNGVLARVYNYGLDLISQRDVASGTTLYFGYDGLGSTRYLTTTNGTVANVFAYDAPLLARRGHTQWHPDLIYFDATNVYLTANYYVQMLFGQNSDDRYLQTTIEPVTTPATLTASTVRDSKSGDLIIKIVNGAETPAQLAIKLLGLPNTELKGTKTVLTGPSPDAFNEDGKEPVIKPVTANVTFKPAFDYQAPAYSLTVFRVRG